MSIEFSRPDWGDIWTGVEYLTRMWAVYTAVMAACIWPLFGITVVHELFADTALVQDTMPARALIWTFFVPLFGVLSYALLWAIGLFVGDAGRYTHLTANVFGVYAGSSFVLGVLWDIDFMFISRVFLL